MKPLACTQPVAHHTLLTTGGDTCMGRDESDGQSAKNRLSGRKVQNNARHPTICLLKSAPIHVNTGRSTRCPQVLPRTFNPETYVEDQTKIV